MTRPIVLSCATVLGLVLSGPVLAQPPNSPHPARQFQGYWIGVDPLDGGDSRRGFIQQSNGTFAMAGRDTILTLCDGTDRGFISVDDAVVRGPRSLATDGLTIACTNTGASVVLRARYELLADGLMVEQTTTQAGAPVSRIVLHRIGGGERAGVVAVPPGRTTELWQGYWMGVDPVDGGDARRSLVLQDNGRFALAARDTVLTLCGGTDRGFASFDDGLLVSATVMRSDSLTIRCLDGPEVVLHVRYELVARGLMLEHTALENGTPVGTIVLHKVGP